MDLVFQVKKEEILKSSFIRFILLNSCLKYITFIVENTEYRKIIWKILCNVYIKLAITGNVLCVVSLFTIAFWLIGGKKNSWLSAENISCVRGILLYDKMH